MVLKMGTDEEQRSSPRALRGSMSRLILRVASQLLGGSIVATEPVKRGPAKQDESLGDVANVSASEQPFPRHGPIVKRSNEAAEAAQNLEQTLAHFESMLDALESQVHGNGPAATPAPASAGERDAEPGLNGTVERMENVLNRLASQAQRLSDGASDLAQVAGQMENRLADVARALREGVTAPRKVEAPVEAPEHVPEPEPETEAEPAEPQFQPGEKPLGVVLAAVSGFQGLMDAQRALSALEQTEAASVTAFKNGEASLEVVLRSPVTAREIIAGVRDSTGEQLLIEESRPEAGKLRLRFVENGGSTGA